MESIICYNIPGLANYENVHFNDSYFRSSAKNVIINYFH